MDSFRIVEILDEVKFRDWTFEVEPMNEWGDFTLRARFEAPDNFNGGNLATQWTRKWVIERDDSDSDVAKTAFLCVLTATEHEVREDFRYKGRRIFSPHRKP